MEQSVITLTLNIDKELKEKADALFEELGLDLQSAFNIFLRQCLREDRIPFEITTITPVEKKLKKALEEAKHSDSVDQSRLEKLLEEINVMVE